MYCTIHRRRLLVEAAVSGDLNQDSVLVVFFPMLSFFKRDSSHGLPFRDMYNKGLSLLGASFPVVQLASDISLRNQATKGENRAANLANKSPERARMRIYVLVFVIAVTAFGTAEDLEFHLLPFCVVRVHFCRFFDWNKMQLLTK